MSDRAAVELFHLVFVAELGRKLDSKLYAIKGGCNPERLVLRVVEALEGSPS